MAERKITPDDAFRLLQEASQRRNVKLRSLAQDVVDTGTLLPDD
jgi:AmiR/NasT family two-component response regulator